MNRKSIKFVHVLFKRRHGNKLQVNDLIFLIIGSLSQTIFLLYNLQMNCFEAFLKTIVKLPTYFVKIAMLKICIYNMLYCNTKSINIEPKVPLENSLNLRIRTVRTLWQSIVRIICDFQS